MVDYEIALLWASGLLLTSLITGFTALTNRQPIGMPLVVFVIGGLVLYYAGTLNADGSFAQDIPGAVYNLYALVMN